MLLNNANIHMLASNQHVEMKSGAGERVFSVLHLK